MTAPRIAVIGGGLVGLATARALRRLRPGATLTLLEKEDGVARHQSGRNSGVLHAGLYYTPGSLKARMAVEGIRTMRAFLEEHGVPHEICGKVVVAAHDGEEGALEALHRRGRANGLAGLRFLTREELKEREPHVRAVKALLVPEEGIADYPAAAEAMRRELTANGARVLVGRRLVKIRRAGKARVLVAEGKGGGEEIETDLLVNCAGLHSDRIARMDGLEPGVRIVPFRGEYLTLRPEAERLCRHLIYPTPDPRFPFLGVHFTRMIRGGVECGPNAVLAFRREGYRLRDVSASDLAESLAWPGLRRFLVRHPRTVTGELRQSLSRKAFLTSIRRLVPDVTLDDLRPGPAGVRAQAIDRNGDLVQDFSFAKAPGALHVVNAPSPGATASLTLGAHLAGEALALLEG